MTNYQDVYEQVFNELTEKEAVKVKRIDVLQMASEGMNAEEIVEVLREEMNVKTVLDYQDQVGRFIAERMW